MLCVINVVTTEDLQLPRIISDEHCMMRSYATRRKATNLVRFVKSEGMLCWKDVVTR